MTRHKKARQASGVLTLPTLPISPSEAADFERPARRTRSSTVKQSNRAGYSFHRRIVQGRSFGKLIHSFLKLNRIITARANYNKVVIDVDIRQLMAVSGQISEDGVEQLLNNQLSHLPALVFDDNQPRVFVDKNNVVIAHHFPGYLSEHANRVHAIYLNNFSKVYKPTLKSADAKGRGAPIGYRAFGDNLVGCTHISPGWHEIGHDHVACRPSLSILAPKSKDRGAAVHTLMGQLEPYQRRLDDLLRLTYPDVHRAFAESMEYLRHGDVTGPFARNWASSFQGISLIHNRATPWHQDDKGCETGVDALLTLGSYHGARLVLSVLRVTLSYEPGTLVIVHGRTLPHEVTDWNTGGDRICLVHFTHENLLKESNTRHPCLTYLK